jgi:hypothetical protein
MRLKLLVLFLLELLMLSDSLTLPINLEYGGNATPTQIRYYHESVLSDPDCDGLQI